jgi:DNA-binding CsgD family transcriptional regulator
MISTRQPRSPWLGYQTIRHQFEGARTNVITINVLHDELEALTMTPIAPFHTGRQHELCFRISILPSITLGNTMMTNRDPIFTEDEWISLHKLLELPPRQRQVIRQLFDGHSDKQIADQIGIALPTVRSHLRRLYTRFDVQDRTELVLHVVRVHLQSNGRPPRPINSDDINSDDG